MQIDWKPSPNFSPGRRGQTAVAIVVHIMDGTLAGTDAWFASRGSKVSAHYGVGKNGEVHQYVDEDDTAQHAGIVDSPAALVVRQRLTLNPNLYTVGIEHEGRDGDALTPAQADASAELIAEIASDWGIPLDREHVIAHHEIRASKTCPGKGVDIDALIALAIQKQAANDAQN